MRRRDFIAGIIGSATAWPFTARAQQLNRVPRIGVLTGYREGDPILERDLNAFYDGLRELGWIAGKNVQIDHRNVHEVEGMRARALELLSFGPDLLVTVATPATRAARQASPSIPIVFIAVSDPIEAGFVKSFPHPEGNTTGFTNTEPTIGSKWLGLLLEIVPSMSRVGLLFNPETSNAGASGSVYLKSIEAATRLRDKELVVSAVHDPAGIDKAFAAMAKVSGGGFIVTPSGFAVANRDHIVATAAQYSVPTIYSNVDYIKAGGLMSYGIDLTDIYQRPAQYVDRILKGAKPADLPVQAPIKFNLVINLRAVAALGLTVPPTLRTLAADVIE